MFFAFDNVVTSGWGFIIRIRREEIVWIGFDSGLFRFLGLGFGLGLNGWVGRFVGLDRFVGLGRFIGIARSDRDSFVFSLSSFGFLGSAQSFAQYRYLQAAFRLRSYPGARSGIPALPVTSHVPWDA